VIVIICGVSGAGKTTVGKLLAQELGWHFYEADDFHSPGNVEKMRTGVPLTDEDRWPWLENLRELIERELSAGENVVLACSALKRKISRTSSRRSRREADLSSWRLRVHYRTTASQARSLHESGVTAKSIWRFGGTTARATRDNDRIGAASTRARRRNQGETVSRQE